MTTKTLFALALLAWTARVPPAQETCKLYLAERYEQAWTEAKARNVPVLIMDFDGWEGPGLDDFLEDRSFLKAADRAVIILSSEHQYGEKEQIVRGEVRGVCAKFGCVSPATHRRMKQAVFRDFAEEGILKTPLFVVATAEKKVIERLTEENPVSSVMQAMMNGLRQVERTGGGRGLGREDFELLAESLQTIEGAMDRKQWRSAVRATEALGDLVEGSLPIHTRLTQSTARLQEAGIALIGEAEEKWTSGEHLSALFAIDETAFLFTGHPVGKAAAKKLKDWSRSADGKKHSRALKRESTARRLYFEGCDLEQAQEFKRALSPLRRLVKTYPDTLWAEQAASLITVCEEALR